MILRQEGDGDGRHQPPPLQGNRPGGCQWDSDATQWQQRGYYAHSGPEGAAGLRVRVAAAVAASQGPGRGRPVAAPDEEAKNPPVAASGRRSGPVGAVWAPAHFGVLES
jgi:hypothetical protein